MPQRQIDNLARARRANSLLASVDQSGSVALDAGATRDEVLATFNGVSVLGIHSVALTLPILFDEAQAASVEPVPRPTARRRRSSKE